MKENNIEERIEEIKNIYEWKKWEYGLMCSHRNVGYLLPLSPLESQILFSDNLVEKDRFNIFGDQFLFVNSKEEVLIVSGTRSDIIYLTEFSNETIYNLHYHLSERIKTIL